MKQSSKNETDLLNLINKLQEQLVALDKKVDILIHRPLPETRLVPKPPVNADPLQARTNDHNKGRVMHKAICADCKKECSIPFKPSGDRPVYCQDCFSRRKMISMSGMKIEDKPIVITEPKEKIKKKTVTTKKPAAKKKLAPKKK
jgi:CxxC-x17-CxxC domain-containing protein